MSRRLGIAVPMQQSSKPASVLIVLIALVAILVIAGTVLLLDGLQEPAGLEAQGHGGRDAAPRGPSPASTDANELESDRLNPPAAPDAPQVPSVPPESDWVRSSLARLSGCLPLGDWNHPLARDLAIELLRRQTVTDCEQDWLHAYLQRGEFWLLEDAKIARLLELSDCDLLAVANAGGSTASGLQLLSRVLRASECVPASANMSEVLGFLLEHGCSATDMDSMVEIMGRCPLEPEYEMLGFQPVQHRLPASMAPIAAAALRDLGAEDFQATQFVSMYLAKLASSGSVEAAEVLHWFVDDAIYGVEQTHEPSSGARTRFAVGLNRLLDSVPSESATQRVQQLLEHSDAEVCTQALSAVAQLIETSEGAARDRLLSDLRRRVFPPYGPQGELVAYYACTYLRRLDPEFATTAQAALDASNQPERVLRRLRASLRKFEERER